jgi:hypothetical protein
LTGFQIVGNDAIYDPHSNQILSVSTGKTAWASGDPFFHYGAIAGSNVIFVSGTNVLIQPH